MRAYLDTNVVVYLVEETEPWHSRVSRAMDRAGDLEILTSDLVRMESLVLPLRNRNLQLVADFKEFLGRYQCAGLAASAFDRAAELRAETFLRTPDALHIACAVESACDEFWTNDHRLSRLSLPLSVRVFA